MLKVMKHDDSKDDYGEEETPCQEHDPLFVQACTIDIHRI